jgi:hypothetical protein
MQYKQVKECRTKQSMSSLQQTEKDGPQNCPSHLLSSIHLVVVAKSKDLHKTVWYGAVDKF